MNLEDDTFGQRFFFLRQFFDKCDGFLMVDGFQVFAHTFSAYREPFFYHKCGFLQGQRIAFYPVAFVGIFYVEGFPYFFQCFFGKGAQRA